MTPPVAGRATPLPENNLDVLRASAVLCVFLDHLSSFVGLRTEFMVWLGQAGVQAFFVHTALVLMSSLERDGAPARTGWVRRFYVRRAFRIYPLAWVVIAAVVILRIPPGDPVTSFEPPDTVSMVAHAALAQNLVGKQDVLTPLWTLPLEIQMYALLPLCFLIARLDSRKWMSVMILSGIALAGVFFATRMAEYRVPNMWRLNLLVFIPCFLMGVLAYWLLRQRRGVTPPLPSWSWPIIILASIAVLFVPWHFGLEWPDRVALCAVLGFAIPRVRDAAPSVFVRIAHTIAVYSYSIYLTHLLALRVGFFVLRESGLPVQLLATSAALAVLCLGAYHLIEKPGIALGQRLVGGRNRADSLEATAPPP